MKTGLALFLLACVAAAAQEGPKPLGAVMEGVYFTREGNRTNVLELKEGRFRRWYAGTVMLGGVRNNPDVKPGPRFTSNLYSGIYTTNGGTVKFVIERTNAPRRPFYTNEFTFMEFKGKITLWTPAAQRTWEKDKTVSAIGILEATDRKPEEILEGK
jgi:hypothetical protein